MDSRQIVINVPDKVLLAIKVDDATFAREVVLLAAIKLYELGRLSSGRAAELAGIPRVGFLLALERYKVFPLAAELDEVERPSRHIKSIG
jgi:predicted HTH domain antitoxin